MKQQNESVHDLSLMGPNIKFWSIGSPSYYGSFSFSLYKFFLSPFYSSSIDYLLFEELMFSDF